MPWKPPRHCPRGHPPYTGPRCPICTAASRPASRLTSEAVRPSARERGYDSKWDKARKDYLAAHPSCISCGVPATVVDHKVPHKGDRKLFWSRSNWQPLCRACHGRKTVREDGGFGNKVTRNDAP